MKKIILFFLFVVIIVSNIKSQNYDLPIDSTGNVVYQGVVHCNLSKNKLYANAQEWIAKTFGNYKSVIQLEDKQNDKLILKGTTAVKHFVEANIGGMTISNSEQIGFTLTIECRNNKYRYTMDNIDVIFQTGGQDFERSIFDRINEVKTSRNKIKILKNQLHTLKEINTSSYKKRQLKKYQNNIDLLKQQIEYESSNVKDNVEFIDSELEAINVVIQSLKKAMVKADNF